MLDEEFIKNLILLYNFYKYLVINYLIVVIMRIFLKRGFFGVFKNCSINRLLDEVILSNFMIKYLRNK